MEEEEEEAGSSPSPLRVGGLSTVLNENQGGYNARFLAQTDLYCVLLLPPAHRRPLRTEKERAQ